MSSSASAGNTILVFTHSDSVPVVQDFLRVLVNPDAELPLPPRNPHPQGEQAEEQASQRTVEWHIDNKYYTARVRFLIHEYDQDPQEDEKEAATGNTLKDVPAVIYAYTLSNHVPLPRTLLDSISAASPELSFAIRIPHARPFTSDETIAEKEEEAYDPVVEEELMDEAGMEYIDFTSLYNPTPKLRGAMDFAAQPTIPTTSREALRQFCDSLQTIMWPSMRRKELPSVRGRRNQAEAAAAVPSAGERTAMMSPDVLAPPATLTSVLPSSSTSSQGDGFPVLFPTPTSPTTATPNRTLASSPAQSLKKERRNPGTTHHPVNPFDLSPSAEQALLVRENEELEAWLNTEDVRGGPDGCVPDSRDPGLTSHDKKNAGKEEEVTEGQGFDDDFSSWDIRKLVDQALVGVGDDADDDDDDEFSAFQSAAPRGTIPYAPAPHTTHNHKNDDDDHYLALSAERVSSHPNDDTNDFNNDSDDDLGIPLDPRALLNHLQSLRAELAGVQDEDERRARAGKEVVDILKGLGIRLDELDLDLEGEVGL
ncbi:hypothetical protein QFC21_004454 [Naganishia friedmannii]|uniref:Uncharacterized protein n=1 Tax=Naganishia friedmannii TaxID=89922 RepID=A0ACC2VFF4_9TREE|nr:hypothetical protein QFC21_004454 [Naganishia friedmannii]